MQDVTVYADEHAALQLVSQGSIQNGGRRVSRSKQEPLELTERRRSHSRASMPNAKDMQTGAPSLDFQIMYALRGHHVMRSPSKPMFDRQVNNSDVLTTASGGCRDVDQCCPEHVELAACGGGLDLSE